ncbi:Uncharacterised protein [Vibrio cholerae]|uniref:Uncharacterized protein n=1 Tax=Vibrio cholerae TaxID=666 RepID=A0A655PRP2_VIBCL|nr:Uncharacterised protein [Vibrio cholerae]
MRSTGALSASLFSSANETGGSNCPSMIASSIRAPFSLRVARLKISSIKLSSITTSAL